jgi:hypothetical protein
MKGDVAMRGTIIGVTLLALVGILALWWAPSEPRRETDFDLEGLRMPDPRREAPGVPAPEVERPAATRSASAQGTEVLVAPKDPRSGEPLASLELDEMDEVAAAEAEDPAAEARRIRLPLIMAIRGRHSSPEARREAMLEALRRSGASSEDWTREASTVFARWDAALAVDIARAVELREARCFRAGCEVPVVFPDRAAFERAATAFRSIHEAEAVHGGRVQTPPVVRPDGTIEASWLMLRPDGVES